VLAQTEVTWGEHVQDMTRKILFGRERSWFTGYNSNVDREYTNKVMIYAGGAIRYRDFLGRETTKGYPGFELS
jgi:hypothetical protein